MGLFTALTIALRSWKTKQTHIELIFQAKEKISQLSHCDFNVCVVNEENWSAVAIF